MRLVMKGNVGAREAPFFVTCGNKLSHIEPL